MKFWTLLLFLSLCCHLSSGQYSACRMSSLGGIELPPSKFSSLACSECFFFIYGNMEANKRFYMFGRICINGLLICRLEEVHSSLCSCDNAAKVYNLPGFAIHNFTSFEKAVDLEMTLPPGFVQVTRDCCDAARRCCYDTLMKSNQTPGEPHCPATWDGWQCWRSTPAGQNVQGICPLYSYGGYGDAPVIPVNNSVKRCMPDGSWFRPSNTSAEWTDYSGCVEGALETRYVKLIVNIVAFAVSVVTIIPALIIFSVYRTLSMQSVIALHRHLLLSFLLTGSFFIFNSLFFIARNGGEHLVAVNHISCRILFTVQLRYLRLANYMWMLCEGWYLHRLLVAAFSEPSSLLTYYILGWGVPLIPTLFYSVARAKLDDSGCWILASREVWIEWLFQTPCLVALCTNLVLMVYVLTVLVKKIRNDSEMQPAQYKKAVRATLMLLPMFGVHFFLTIYRVPSYAYEIFNNLLDGLQGFLVAIIICYTNSRVTELLKSTWKKSRENRQMRKESIARRRTYKTCDGEDASQLMLQKLRRHSQKPRRDGTTCTEF